MILECTIQVECDECGDEESFDVNAASDGFNDIELKRAVAQSGWEIRSNFHGPRLLCDTCKGKEDGDDE